MVNFFDGSRSKRGNIYAFGRDMLNGPPSMTNWKPPMGGRGNYPGIEHPGNQFPPQTGGPLPPFNGGSANFQGGGNSANFGAGQPGNGPMGGTMIPGGERPGTYGVPPGFRMGPGQGGTPPGFLGEPGVFPGNNAMNAGPRQPGQMPRFNVRPPVRGL